MHCQTLSNTICGDDNYSLDQTCETLGRSKGRFAEWRNIARSEAAFDLEVGSLECRMPVLIRKKNSRFENVRIKYRHITAIVACD